MLLTISAARGGKSEADFAPRRWENWHIWNSGAEAWKAWSSFCSSTVFSWLSGLFNPQNLRCLLILSSNYARVFIFPAIFCFSLVLGGARGVRSSWRHSDSSWESQTPSPSSLQPRAQSSRVKTQIGADITDTFAQICGRSALISVMGASAPSPCQNRGRWIQTRLAGLS